eukprot:scaffold3299_cov116-Isochrysis_galbana.AAC.1
MRLAEWLSLHVRSWKAFVECQLTEDARTRANAVGADAIFRFESVRICLHATAEAQHQVKGRLLLDVVVRQRAAVLELLAREDQTLLVRRDALLVLDLGLHIVNRV